MVSYPCVTPPWCRWPAGPGRAARRPATAATAFEGCGALRETIREAALNGTVEVVDGGEERTAQTR
ncbi:hypothetical protein [Streptomyces sp. NPDC059783]|uniref:hypothetical protein n=1 Tax=Streptomyces sp. NPDC059783 TaxID=3346944 RepID=UPI00364752E6